MNAVFWQIVAGIVMLVLGSVAQIWIIRWAKRDSVPDELREEISQLGRDLVVVRGQIKYIQGILNGKHWRREEG